MILSTPRVRHLEPKDNIVKKGQRKLEVDRCMQALAGTVAA